MDVRQLEFFSAIVQEGGFNKAAAKLFVSQSAVSRGIRLLEEELRERLFLRVGRRIVLTPAGEALLRHSRLIFRHLKSAAVEISEIAGLQRGQLSVGAGWTDFSYLLKPVLKKFHEMFPAVELRLTADTVAEILPQIKDGRVDLGILTLPIVDKDLVVTKLCSEELLVAVSRDHPWAKRNAIRAAALADCPFILHHRGTNIRSLLEAVFAELGAKPKVVMEMSNFAVIVSLVEINLGMSIVPHSLAVIEAKNKRLHFLRIKEKRVERELGLVHLRANFLPRAVSEMISFLKAELGGGRGKLRSASRLTKNSA